MQTLRYSDQPLEPLLAAAPSSIFLAGPTARYGAHTPWRRDALALLDRGGFLGAVLLPEFADLSWNDGLERHFASADSQIPHLRGASRAVLEWETCGIERSTVVLFWMPFRIGNDTDPDALPGLTTRAEVSREVARAPHRVVLGMPPVAATGGHIRYHAHRSGVTIHDTLEATVDAAIHLADEISSRARHAP